MGQNLEVSSLGVGLCQLQVVEENALRWGGRIHGKDARREGKYFECMVGGACTVVGKKKKKELDLFARNNIVTN